MADAGHSGSGDVWIVDGNEAVADVAFRTNEVVAIYPITPASPMGEHADAWAAAGRENLWGDVPQVAEMQSEGGAAGAIHGSAQAGALSTTFTASQGLLLMIPNMFKLAGELTAATIHVAARTVATHALSIFAEHSDVYAARQTGWGMLASGSVQEAHDLALIAEVASLESRIPFVHFFDGFRTSHEMAGVQRIGDDLIGQLIDDGRVAEHRARALSPEHPVVRGTAHNPDTYFQAREAVNGYYDRCPGLVQGVMDRLAEATGRHYGLFDYHGHPQAERVLVLMGSGCGAAWEMVDWLCARGERVGLVSVRLYRPFSAEQFVAALPPTTKEIAVLDRTKEPGAPGEPLHLDVVAALHRQICGGESPFSAMPRVTGGRYGLSSKEFTPTMVKGVYDAMGSGLPHGFTVGIHDDVTNLSVGYDADLDIEHDDVTRAVFFGLGADGTVGGNKNSIKILGTGTDLHAQGYFVYDSKKSGARTVSHLRLSPRPIRSTYLIRQAGFVGVHQWGFFEKFDVLSAAAPGAKVLINAPVPPDQVFDRLPVEAQEQILQLGLELYTIDAYKVAQQAGLGGRINTLMQTCFFALSGILEVSDATARIKDSIEKTYGRKGRELVMRNFAAVDAALDHLHAVPVPAEPTTERARPPVVPDDAPDFVRAVTAVMMAGQGDALPVSAFPPDGTWPTGTSKWERRAIAREVPIWDPSICIQCNKCALVCPHSAIRTKAYPASAAVGAPEGFRTMAWKGKDLPDHGYTVQLVVDDCTGCALCVEVCPAKDKSNPRHKSLDMGPVEPVRDTEREVYPFFGDLPELEHADLPKVNVKTSQLLEPLFEASGACSGCGETPYVKLLSQLFGDRLLIANATGCSSIFGGNLPTTPFSQNAEGRGPAWSNSLFEDNAEFGFGFMLAAEQQAIEARRQLTNMADTVGAELAGAIVDADQTTEAGIREQRKRVAELGALLAGLDSADAARMVSLAEYLVRRSTWIVGGDGWAYDIGYGGLDHVLASGRNVNILVLDTEVYSNTGGQQSKATPMGAVAKFAAAGRGVPKKDLGLLAMSYGHVYVAQVAMGAKDKQTLDAFLEAESYEGTSLIIAYSHCIAHGYDLTFGLRQQQLAVDSGHWPLYRYDPRRAAEERPALKLDSGRPKVRLKDYIYNETRYRMLQHADPERAAELLRGAEREIKRRFDVYEQLAGRARK